MRDLTPCNSHSDFRVAGITKQFAILLLLLLVVYETLRIPSTITVSYVDVRSQIQTYN